jgi:cytochrome c oxidase subunit IV
MLFQRFILKFDRLKGNSRFSIILFLSILAVGFLSSIAITYGEPANAYLFINPPMSIA